MLADRLNPILRKLPTWPLYVAAMLYAPWLFYLAATGQMGPEPINALEREYGEIGLIFLVLGLLVTPLRRFAGVNALKFRRLLGLMAFYYVSAHLLVWVLLDVQILSQIWAEIVKRPYITVGMAGFVLMLPLAATSNNRSIRRLGAKWRKLHQLTYVIVPLGALHYVMVTKVWEVEALAYLLIGIGLVATRARMILPKPVRA
jgi:sulfoxide reductase heme-binding subunit YedZ